MQARDYSTREYLCPQAASARVHNGLVVTEERREGKSRVAFDGNLAEPRSYLRMTSTSPARRFAAIFPLSRCKAATVVLYEEAILLRVSPFFTL